MVGLAAMRESTIALVESQPLIAVISGATAGIGRSSLIALATAHASRGKGLRVYVIGRNAASAEKAIAECVRVCPSGQFIFKKAQDLSLMKDVDAVTADILKAEEVEAAKTGDTPRIDILIMTHAIVEFNGRQDTEEGIDRAMSLLFYSRMRMITQLMPLLLAASPLPARIISVWGPGREAKIYPDDLSLRAPAHYGFLGGTHCAYMKTFFMERLVAEHPGKLCMVHTFPGLVLTEAFWAASNPWWFRWLVTLLAPIARPFTIPPSESGERVLFLAASPRFVAGGSGADAVAGVEKKGLKVATAANGVLGGGYYRVKYDGETIPSEKVYQKPREDGMAEKFNNHTLKVFEEIEAGRVFKD